MVDGEFACILIKTNNAKSDIDVIKHLRDLEDVLQIDPLYGEFDIMVKCKVDENSGVFHIIKDIEGIPGVVSIKALKDYIQPRSNQS